MKYLQLLCVAATLLGLAGSAMCDDDAARLAPLVAIVGESDDATLQKDLLAGMREGLRGRKRVPMPAGWSEAYARLSKSPDAAVREHALALALTFGDPRAVASLQKVIRDRAAAAPARQRALETLAESRAAELAPLLQRLLDDRAVRGAAIRALAAYPQPDTPRMLLERYPELTRDERQDVIQTLASRADFALALLNAVEKKIVARGDISAITARQLAALNDSTVSDRVKDVWGDIRATGEEKQQLIARYKSLLTGELLKDGDPSHGRLVYQKTCQNCHRLFGEGGAIGPDLTGSNRANLDYILENVADPSAIIPREWRMSTVITAGGRVLTGIIVENAPEAVILQTVNERLTISREDIEELNPTALSMMPEGQFETLQPAEIRDLIVYLRTTEQVPLPAGAAQNATSALP